ncbi:unnamed protein product [Urochloa decumbens]|uniref:F-box domain-containing protein n=1 Tax=Urochloa decumbens TaxID=240449 RepID=A0ABC9GNJ9_9POAL
MGKWGKNVAASASSIDALPDGILEHILGFVPAPEAVRTCVLASRWRNLWKRATGLRITCIGDDVKATEFVGHILRLRGHTPLETCDLRFCNFDEDDDTLLMNGWLRHVVASRVRMFRLENFFQDGFQLEDMPFVSQHLTRLDLIGVNLKSRLCDFSSCPSLEHLEIRTCYWWSDIRISSESLKHLAITDCDFTTELHALIHVPSLVSLTLDGHFSSAPVLGCMPSLQEAFVRVIRESGFTSDHSHYWDCDYEDCYSCHGTVHGNGMCVLLGGLSEAENLALVSESKTFVFGKDLKHCPTFSKLKTLVLNDHWCVAPDFPAVTCILKHSPVLENLTLQLFSKGPQHKIEMIGTCSSMYRSLATSEHLKAIKVKCEVVDEEVHKVLKFLCSFNISFIFK